MAKNKVGARAAGSLNPASKMPSSLLLSKKVDGLVIIWILGGRCSPTFSSVGQGGLAGSE